MLCPGDDGFIDQVKGYIYLPTKKEFYSPGKSNKAIFGNVDLTFRMLACINASGIHIPKSGIKYNQFIIVIRGEPINLVWPPKGFNKFKYNS
jgi:hypothetical protein